MQLKTKPLPYQRKAARKLERFNGRGLVGDEMGLGKSFEALLYAYHQNYTQPIIVVCPASVKYNWENEAKIHFKARAVVIEGRKVKRLPQAPIYIINYDILHNWVATIQELKPALIILDECHYIKDRSTLRYKTVRRLCKKVKHILCLSGTPLTNRPAELWPSLNLLRPDLFPSFYAFARRYCSPRLRRWGWEYKGAVRMPELHRKLVRMVMIRRLKKDVLHQLPNKRLLVVPLEIERRKEYEMAKQEFGKWLRSTGYTKGKVKKALRAEALTQTGYLQRLTAELKFAAVVKWITDYLEESSGKIIVFGIHKKMVRGLYDHFKSLSVVVDGSVTGKKRQHAFQSFTNDKRIRILFGNLRAAGVGWNGTAAEATVTVEIGWTPGEHDQADDRIHRIGQKQKTTSYYLVARDTVEERLCEVVQKKKVHLRNILDGVNDTGGLDIFNKLMSIIENKE